MCITGVMSAGSAGSNVLSSAGNFCDRTWDGWLCWGDTAPGTAMQMCPEYFFDFDPAGEALTHTYIIPGVLYETYSYFPRFGLNHVCPVCEQYFDLFSPFFSLRLFAKNY